ncbi:hypothetical protein FOFC_10184 [Fusarium oxysporum]|nr:hypothetical protein FOFC_10184 [Fusarium oxysporum]
MDAKRNIVVVGGGIIGSTTAYYLTRHSKFNPALHTITLLEAAPTIAQGASGKAGGLLALWAYPECLVPLSYRLHAELAAEHNGPERWGYRQLGCGSFDAVVTRDKIKSLQANGNGSANGSENGKDWEKLPKQNGAAKELLEEGILPKDLDWVDHSIINSWSEMGAPGKTETSQVHPLHFTTAIAELAQQGGAQIHTNAKVTKINSTKNGVESIEYLDRNTGETKTIASVTDIVVAAGPWTNKVLPRARIEGLRAHSVVFDANVSPYAVFTDIQLPPDFIPEHRAKMGQKRRHRGNVDPEIYARPFNEAYACGEPDTNVPLPETADQVECDEAQCDDIISYISTFSPVLAAAPIKAKQACYLPRHIRFGQESGPLIGRTTVPGLFVAAGHTCWGIQNGPGTGKLMSEFVFDGGAKSADKKARSGRQPIRQLNRSKKILNPRGNDAIAKNWNKKETLSQNYRRLGLVARLKAPTGGTEKKLGATTTRAYPNDPFSIATVENAIVSEARVERDADGKIIRILGEAKPNPLNDPLNDLDNDSDAEPAEEWGGIEDDADATDVVKTLLEQSKQPDLPKKRHQSTREKEWLDKLVAKYGDDTAAMARDRKLNPMQQTAADIAKRIRKMNKE